MDATKDRPAVRAVILAGGSGTRLWPLSRELRPKQLLTLFGTESLIGRALSCAAPFLDDGDRAVTIVTGERLHDELRNHITAEQHGLDEHPPRFLVEPVGRNTAPAIALAAADLVARDGDALMVVLPSDHLLEDSPAWRDTVGAALALGADGYLTTIGVTPTRPETGYGYIKAGRRLEEYDQGVAQPHAVEAFVEKPDLPTAEGYLADGGYQWNAGIFVMRASAILGELRASGEDGERIADTCAWLVEQPHETWQSDAVRRRFEALPSVSVDVAVMERSDKVAVVPADIAWNDVGSLIALEAIGDPDERGNIRRGRGVDVDTSGSIVYAADRLVATLGVEDLVVVDTHDATLVCAKDRCQDVRQVVDALRELGAEEITESRTSMRPWGAWTTLLKGPSYKIKLVEMKEGTKTSLQRHRHRSEHWVVVSGTARVTRDGETIEVHANESAFIPMGAAHRLENCGKMPLKVIEVQVGEYTGEDDIVRIDDDWHRDQAP